MKVTYHVYRDYKLAASQNATDEAVQAASGGDSNIRELRYSLVCATHHPGRNKLYLGATNGAGDVLLEFDLATQKFRSCGAGKSGLPGPHDVKIHKGLALDAAQDAIYFGTATLSGLEKIIDTAGGVLARYDIATGAFTQLGHPVRGEFYQSTCWDLQRRLAYLFTARLGFAVYDYAAGKLIRYESMESIPHNSCLDDAGGAWGTYGSAEHQFFRFNPATMAFEFPGTAFPNAAAAANIQYPGAGPVDAMINGGDGFIYTANAFGELYRLDPRDGTVTFLGKPFAPRRVPALAMGADGWLYLAGGYRPISMLSRYHVVEKRFEYFGEIRHEDGTWMEYVHEIAVVGNSVYALETDNMKRSGYLWQCEV